MAGTLRLNNTGTGNGQSTITTAASGDTTYTLPSGGGTFVTTSSTQALTVPFASGTVSAPSITFLGDSNTGLYSPAADTIAFTEGGTESFRCDSLGRLLVGTSSASGSAFFHVQGRAGATTDYAPIALRRGSLPSAADQTLGLISFTDNSENQGAWIYAESDGGSWTSGSNHRSRLVFSTTADGASSPTERMRITSANTFWFGNTSSLGTYKYHMPFAGNSTNGFAIQNSDSAGTPNALSFLWGTTGVGNISFTNTTTTYGTSSDYRLKENVTAVTDGIARLLQLKPSRFNFIVDPDHTVDGFIAHEVQAVVPEAITGEKDAVDDEGNPVYQGIDQSKLVPLLTAALQEAIGEIESLKARVAALEAQ